jgi:hypothetical protein
MVHFFSWNSKYVRELFVEEIGSDLDEEMQGKVMLFGKLDHGYWNSQCG